MNLTRLKGVLFTLVFFAFLMVSCDSKKENTVAKKKAVEITNTVIKVQLDSNLSSNSSFDVKLVFPKLINVDSSLLKTVLGQVSHKFINKSTISDSIFETREQAIQELEIAYNAFKKDFPEINSEWYLHRKVEVVYQSDKYVSILKHELSYLGGAHSNELKKYITYDISNGNRIWLIQLLSNEDYAIAEKLAEEAFRKQKGFKPKDDLKANGWYFPNGNFTLNNNYFLTDSSILIHYNTYDIGSYAAGSTTLEIDKDKVMKKET